MQTIIKPIIYPITPKAPQREVKSSMLRWSIVTRTNN